ncbi:MAG: 50S ribosomal protein L30 [Thermoanaerobaculia bacterium]
MKIKQVRSPIGCNKKQREVLKGLGLRKIGQVVKRENKPSILGMVKKIPHLVQIVEE